MKRAGKKKISLLKEKNEIEIEIEHQWCFHVPLTHASPKACTLFVSMRAWRFIVDYILFGSMHWQHKWHTHTHSMRKKKKCCCCRVAKLKYSWRSFLFCLHIFCSIAVPLSQLIPFFTLHFFYSVCWTKPHCVLFRLEIASLVLVVRCLEVFAWISYYLGHIVRCLVFTCRKYSSFLGFFFDLGSFFFAPPFHLQRRASL